MSESASLACRRHHCRCSDEAAALASLFAAATATPPSGQQTATTTNILGLTSNHPTVIASVPLVPSAVVTSSVQTPQQVVAVSQVQSQQQSSALIVDNVLPVINMLQGNYPTASFVNTQGGVGLITNVTVNTVYVDPGECPLSLLHFK